MNSKEENAVNVLKFGEGIKIIIDDPELEKMFLHPDIKNRKVMVFSIIGAFRRGKSFFLDYCLRFLYATYPSIKNPNKERSSSDWMGAETMPLAGFSWRSGTKRDTTGIIMWSDIFLHTIATTGEKFAIIVMDTQGLFDNETSMADNSRIFALGTLISSVQVLNLVEIIQEDQLQYLQFATEFAKFAAQDSQGTACKPFQNLLFLIRDWKNPDEFEFGTEGGERYLKSVLKIKSEQKPELKSVRQSIASSFEQIRCSLMPYPGKDVATSKNYDGRWGLMDEEFKDELVIIIEKLLGPQNLVLKKINGKFLEGHELLKYIQSYFTLFESDTLPQAQLIFESTVDCQMSIIVEKCLSAYKKSIKEKEEMATEDNLHIFHEWSASKTLIMFKDEKKMANASHELKYRNQLEAAMEKLYTEWRDSLIKHFQQVKAEIEKNKALIKENLELEQETLDATIKIKKQKEELELQKNSILIRDQKFEAQKAEMTQRLEAEKERSKRIEAERDAAQNSKNDLNKTLSLMMMMRMLSDMSFSPLHLARFQPPK